MAIFQTATFFQRMLESVLDAGWALGKHAVGGIVRGYSAKALSKRARSLANDISLTTTRQAIRDAREQYATWFRRMRNLEGPEKLTIPIRLTVGGPIRLANTALDIGVSTAADAARSAAALAGHAAGTAVGLTARLGIGLPLKLAAIGAKPIAKRASKLALYTALATPVAAFRVGRDTALMAGHTARFLWRNRNDPFFGTVLMAGAMGAGAAHGTYRYTMNAGLGYVNPEIQSPAFLLNETPKPDPEELMANRNVLDNFNATGDLVFALHRLRHGGIL